MLVEKDYWIMHCLWGLQAQGFQFELKGGTSLSKGFGVIHRFSEDIDIRIEPPHGMDVKIGRNQDKPAHVESRRAYYDVYCLLGLQEVQDFMCETAYQERKAQRFRTGDEQVIARNLAFILADPAQRQQFAQEYRKTAALYYQGQPDFDALLARIGQHINVM